MLAHVPSLERLIFELGKLPGIGAKTAGRLAYFLLRQSPDEILALCEALQDISLKIKQCQLCFSYTENDDHCHLCLDPKRSDASLCVVEDPADIFRIETSGAFRGRYHVLHGALSPLDGIHAADLTIDALLKKIDRSHELTSNGTAIEEVILALDADIEGDTTVLYLAELLSQRNIKVTRIAHGVPIGGDIDYVDHRTLGRALENRIQV